MISSLLSILIFATPLFAIKEAVYNAQGVKVGYYEVVGGQKIFYDEWGNPTNDYNMMDEIIKELDRMERLRGEDSEQKRLDKLNKQMDEWISKPKSSSTSSSYTPSQSYKVCPMSYCKHNNSTTSKFCSNCAYSLEGVATSSSHKIETNDDLSALWWILGVFIVGKLLFDKDNDWRWDGVADEDY